MVAPGGGAGARGKPEEAGGRAPRHPWFLQDAPGEHRAAELGHAGFVEAALGVDGKLLVSRNHAWAWPMEAARAGKVDVADLLIGHAWAWPMDAHGPLLMANKAGDTPLHEAVKHGRSAVALKLVDAEPGSGHALNVKQQTPLHIAAREGLYKVVIKINSQPWVHESFVPSDSVSGSALHQAVLGGHARVVEILLDMTPREQIGLTDSSENNALHYAAQKNNARVVKLLLNRMVELAYKRNRDLQSPLHVAAYYGSTKAMAELLKQCPDVAEMVDSNGRNALHVAIVIGKVDVLRCLLKHVRPDEIINKVDNDGNTALHLAAKLNRAPLGLLLLKDRRVNPCLLNREGRTARSITEEQTPVDSFTLFQVYFWKELKKQESIKCKAQQLPPETTPDWLQDLNQYVQQRMGTYTLVATLIATVTFSSTFTMPGGYDQQDGTAILGHRMAFKLFIFANTLAMLTSIVVVFGFIWARREQLDFRTGRVIAWSHWLTVIACLSMVASLTTSVYLTVAAKAPWLAYIVIVMGCSTPVVMFLMLGKDLFATRV
ncbi:LOW QUALITY PROTEIN: hypothetical protein CFC21_090764 [Triticum aestivum]|uniref:PGG domain-containing protein n=2 Tax=Triticum aestivum TaxID=4565 RepID=A0A9R1LEZ0_WHEAT|nr:LOW QUALITY PROTEIN: hypothetical protein CFC21_090764 [Triticum aestivum]